jgi:peptidoglycan/LPS O-acetylase OafA/YrhL
MNKKLDILQVFRGLAAVGVVAHHAAVSTNAFNAKIPEHLSRSFELGFLGVDFFFVLSGFIILNAHFDDAKTANSAKSFVNKRLSRIFPPYWPVSLLLLLLYVFFPRLSEGTRGNISLISSLFLLPDSNPPALSVAWTLIHELMFYILFLLFFVSNKVFSVFCAVWLFVTLVQPFTSNDMGAVFKYLINPINVEFIAGLMCALLYRKFRTMSPSVTIIAGVSLLIAFLAISVDIAHRYLYAIPFGLIVLGSSAASSSVDFRIPRLPVFLGDASYSIYLIHIPLISLVSRIVAKAAPVSGWQLAFTCCVGASIAGGAIYHLGVERPSIRAFKKMMTIAAGRSRRVDAIEKPSEV